MTVNEMLRKEIEKLHEANKQANELDLAQWLHRLNAMVELTKVLTQREELNLE